MPKSTNDCKLYERSFFVECTSFFIAFGIVFNGKKSTKTCETFKKLLKPFWMPKSLKMIVKSTKEAFS